MSGGRIALLVTLWVLIVAAAAATIVGVTTYDYGSTPAPSSAPAVEAPAATVEEAAPQPVNIVAKFKAQLQAAEQAMQDCPAEQKPVDGCAQQITDAQLLAGDIEAAINDSGQAEAYADVLDTIDQIHASGEAFADELCYQGYTAEMDVVNGEPVALNACSEHGAAFSFGYLNLIMSLQTACIPRYGVDACTILD